MFRSRSSALLLLAACGGGQHAASGPPDCPANRTLTLSTQADVDAAARCTSLDALTIRTGAALDLHPLGALQTIRTDLVIGPTLGLEDLALGELRSVGGAIRIESNALLHGVFLPELESAGRLSIAANSAVATVSAPKLTRVAGDVVISEMGSLEIVDLSSLVSIGKDLVIADNPVLNLVELGKLAQVQSMRVEGNRALGELQTSVPTSSGGDHE